MNHWTWKEWKNIADSLEAQGVDLDALNRKWADAFAPSGGVTLNDARHVWLLGVLASEIEPDPIPE